MKKIIVLLIILFIPFVANSATDGVLGNTSTGTININLSLNTVVQITKVKDVLLTYTPGIDNGDLEYVVDLCIYTNHPSGTYKILETSNYADSGVNKVRNSGSTTVKLPYSTQWYTNSTATGPVAHTFTSGNTSPTFNGAHTTSNTCNNGTQNTASIKFHFTEADLLAIPAGNYEDVITLVVSPI